MLLSEVQILRGDVPPVLYPLFHELRKLPNGRHSKTYRYTDIFLETTRLKIATSLTGPLMRSTVYSFPYTSGPTL